MPVAFIEKGLYMLATILKSKKATGTTLAIVEVFAKLLDEMGEMASLQLCIMNYQLCMIHFKHVRRIEK